MKQKLKMIWRILRDRQVVVITEDHGRMYYNWSTRSLEDVCQMCCETFDKAKEMLDKK
nr:MAG TPA: pyrophosphatase/phosphodiesterase [Caudoviricetes sp.]